jgi:uncharacterized integral membrane protein
MRVARFLLSYTILSVFGVMLSMFLAQNEHTEQLAYFGLNISTNFVWVILGAAGSGFVMALLLVLPGRMVAAWRNRTLDREAGYLERQVALLHEEREDFLTRHEQVLEGHERMLLRYERLLAEHRRIIAERDEARAQLAIAGAATIQERTTLPSVSSLSPVSVGRPQSGVARSPRPTPSLVSSGQPARQAPSAPPAHRWIVPATEERSYAASAPR